VEERNTVEDNLESIMSLIANAGEAKSKALEAIGDAKRGDVDVAKVKLEGAGQELIKAHKIQTKLIQKEAGGNKQEITLLMIHAQDHLMNALTIKDLAAEFIDLYEKIN
jgi:PTS system cellobiose-specific IIA component